jgi:Protein of unknown function (DUF4232)
MRLLMALLVIACVAAVDTTVAEEGTAATKRCELTVARPAQVEGVAGTGVIQFKLADRGATSCRISEIPLVGVLNSKRKATRGSSSPGYTLPAHTAFVVRPGRAATFVATYVDHPSPLPARDCTRVSFLSVLLPPYTRPLAIVPLAIPTTVCGDATPYIYVWPRSKWPPG